MRISSIVAVALFALAGIAGAVEEKAAPADQGPESQVGTPAQVFGKVVSMHSVPMVGSTDPHCVVKLESAPGDVEIVDLGSADELKNNGIDVKEGKQLFISGRVGKINSKPLVVAEIVSESKLISISRQGRLVEESTKHADARNADPKAQDSNQPVAHDPKAPKAETVDANQQIRTVEGTVMHSRKVKIEGEANEHILAKLKTEQGIAVVDLGACTALPASVDLTEGKTIAATGVVGQLNGKPIILADSVGNMTSLETPAQPSNVSVPDAQRAK